MTALVYLAWRHIAYRRITSLTLVLVMTTLMTIPMLAETLTRAAEARMMARAQETPLVIGAAGASLDLALSAAYFRDPVDADLTMEDYDWLLDTGLAELAPIHHAGRSRGLPIIGTEIDYFFLRNLAVAEGRLPVRIGEVVLGAGAAARLDAGEGDTVVSDVAQAFDLAGAYPVGLRVSGVLSPSGTPDDDAILTDLKTGWIVYGLGHGHEELTAQSDPSVRLRTAEDGTLTANASLRTREAISPDSLAEFHFHGAPETYPVSAVIALPPDRKASALLQGRVADRGGGHQIVRTGDEIRGLMDNVLRVAEILRGVLLAVSIAALLAMALVVWLTAQMRRREFEIARRLGARRALPFALVGMELGLLAAAAGALSLALLFAATRVGDGMAFIWMIGG